MGDWQRHDRTVDHEFRLAMQPNRRTQQKGAHCSGRRCVAPIRRIALEPPHRQSLGLSRDEQAQVMQFPHHNPIPKQFGQILQVCWPQEELDQFPRDTPILAAQP